MAKITVDQVVGLETELSRLKARVKKIEDVLIEAEKEAEDEARGEAGTVDPDEDEAEPLTAEQAAEIMPAVKLLAPDDDCVAEGADCSKCDQREECYDKYVPKARRRLKLLDGVPYSEEDLEEMPHRDRLALAAAVGVNTFKLKNKKAKGIIRAILKAQDKKQGKKTKKTRKAKTGERTKGAGKKRKGKRGKK